MTPSRRILASYLSLALSLALAGCGGHISSSGSPTTSASVSPTITSVSISCSVPAVAVGQNNQCSAKVQGTGNFNSAVNWSVSSIEGGNSMLGTISSSGLYTAPSIVPSPASVTITASSQQDSTHTANASVKVTLSISFAAQTQSIQLFHSFAFSATVKGVPNTAISWSVNQTVGGNTLIGQIDSTGLYVAPKALPSPSTVTIAATSVADATQAASASVTIMPSPVPAVVSTTPANGGTGIALDAPIQIVFNEALDPATIISSVITLSSASVVVPSSVNYDPTSQTVTLTPIGTLTPQSTYSVDIGGSVADPSGATIEANYQWSFTTQMPSSVTGNVAVPSGVDPTTLTVVSYAGDETAPDSSGNFSAMVTPVGTNAVAAMLPSGSFGLLAFSIAQSQNSDAVASAAIKKALARQSTSTHVPVHITRYQITASQRAASSPDALAVDFQTTAESMLFLTPYLSTSDPSRAAGIMATIAQDPNTGALAQALEVAWSEPNPLEDSGVQTALQEAITSILGTLIGGTPQAESKHALTERAVSTRRLTANDGTTTAPVVTPRCDQGGSPGGLRCLDLDYFNINTTTTPSNGSYTVTLDNQSCGDQHAWLNGKGCAVDWVVLAGPVTTSPRGGVFSVSAGAGSYGPDSPVSSTVGTNCALLSCTSVLYMEGQSTFDDLDVVNVMGEWLANELGTNLPGGVSNAFSISSSLPSDYIVRAYSGSAPTDTVEFNNLLNGQYDQGLLLGGAALVGNTLRGTLKVAEAAKIIPSDSDSCVLTGIADAASATEDIYTIFTSKIQFGKRLYFRL